MTCKIDVCDVESAEEAWSVINTMLWNYVDSNKGEDIKTVAIERIKTEELEEELPLA